MSIYKNVKNACSEAGITITALEAKLGFPRSSICKWDVNTPGLIKLRLLLKNSRNLLSSSQSSVTGKVSDKKDFEPEEEVKVIMRIKIIFHITRMDDVSDVLKKAEELKKENPHTEISIEVLVQKDYFFLISMAFNPVVEIVQLVLELYR